MRIDLKKHFSRRELEQPVSEFIDPFDLIFKIDSSIEEVLHTIQSRKTVSKIEYFFIVDNDNKLLGVVSIRDLLYNPPQTPLVDIVDTDVIKLHEKDTLEKAFKTFSAHQLLALPVINDNERFIGIIEVLPHDQEVGKITKIQHKSFKEDIFQFIGFSIEQRKYNSSFLEFRYRMPWLLLNLVGGLVCAVIGEFFQLTLDEFVILALFIPLVLSLSESVAIQSMTLSLRFLHLRRILWLQVWRRIVVEWRTSLFLSLSSALIIAGFYFAWSIEIKPIIAICSSILLSMITAATFGTFFPIILHVLKLDPKVAAGPVVLMVADIITIGIYLSLSTWILL